MKKKQLQSLFRRIAKVPIVRKKLKGKAVGLFLLPDRKMKAMKKKFLPREKGPANVLAFPEVKQWPHPKGKNLPLGEIYLNKKFADGPDAPLLVLHGLLHLLGYDHKKKRDRIRMENIEKQCLRTM